MLNNMQQMYLKLLQEEKLKKTAEATGFLISNKIANNYSSPKNFTREQVRNNYK